MSGFDNVVSLPFLNTSTETRKAPLLCYQYVNRSLIYAYLMLQAERNLFRVYGGHTWETLDFYQSLMELTCEPPVG